MECLGLYRYTWIMENRLEVERDNANLSDSRIPYLTADFPGQQALDNIPSVHLREVHSRLSISAVLRSVCNVMHKFIAPRIKKLLMPQIAVCREPMLKPGLLRAVPLRSLRRSYVLRIHHSLLVYLRPVLQVLMRRDRLPCPVQHALRQDLLRPLFPLLHQGLQGGRGESFFPPLIHHPPFPCSLVRTPPAPPTLTCPR